ncbi:VOC family protein [Streptomyces sp. BV286]|nr:VOC family protein [Streptomyces sp. BV286]MBV1935587.1 VOC family protein [Streptomyces sp. BV286]
MSSHHICVMVSDLERSLPSYQDLLGFKNVLFESTEPGN